MIKLQEGYVIFVGREGSSDIRIKWSDFVVGVDDGTFDVAENIVGLWQQLVVFSEDGGPLGYVRKAWSEGENKYVDETKLFLKVIAFREPGY